MVARAPRVPQSIRELSFQEVDSFPAFDNINLGDLYALSLSNKTNPFTHGLHRFPAKFVPQVPAWALEQFGGSAKTVLDPFAGSGTTLVEALVHGERSFGLDIDPLARLIARAKTAILDPLRLASLERAIARAWTRPSSEREPPMGEVVNFGHWFSDEACGWLQSLRNVILSIGCAPAEREFLLVVFSSIVRWVSNADDQSQKTYVSGTLKKSPPHVRPTFLRALRRGIEGVSQLTARRHIGVEARTLDEGDACNIPRPASSIDLIITSPPYLDSVDYMYNLMLEYFWLGPLVGVADRSAFNERRRAVIGAKLPRERRVVPSGLAGLLDSSQMSPSRWAAAEVYFDMMQRHFSEAARCLRDGGRYILVVGNSQTRHNVMPVHEALVRLAAAEDLQVEQVFGYRIRRHYMKFPRAGRGGIILIDWVVVLRKSTARADLLHGLPLPWVTLDPGSVAH